jgi:mRNA interferase MazF
LHVRLDEGSEAALEIIRAEGLADEFLDLRTVLVSPTSTSARPASFRPTIDLEGQETPVLVEHTTVVDPQRLGRSAGRLDASELRAVDEALMLVLGL